MAEQTPLSRLRQHLTCPVCHSLLKVPKLLPCLHDICADCLEKSVELQRSREDYRAGSAECPYCGELFGSDDVQTLLTNPTSVNLVEHLRKEDRVTGWGDATASLKADDVGCVGGEREVAPTPTPPPIVELILCAECVHERPAVALCSTCTVYMCEHCDEHHRSARRTNQHKVLRLPQEGGTGERPQEGGTGERPQEGGTGERPHGADRFTGIGHNTWGCGEHDNYPVDLYCRTCDLTVCMKCVICPPHRQHDIDEGKKVIADYYARIDSSLEPASAVRRKVEQATSDIEDMLNRLSANYVTVKRVVEDRYLKLKQELENERVRMVDTADKIFAAKKDCHEVQIEELKEINKKLHESISYVERIRSEQNCIPSEFLALWKHMEQRLMILVDRFEVQNYTPQESDVILFEPNRNAKMEGIIGLVYSDPCPRAFVPTNVASIHFIQGREAQLEFTCQDMIGNVLRSFPHPPVLIVTVVQSEQEVERAEANFADGHYVAKLAVRVSGNVVVAVKANGVNVQGSPFAVTVSPALLSRVTAPVTTLTSQNLPLIGILKSPFGIARSGNTVAVSDHTNQCVLIFRDGLNFERTIEKGGQSNISSIRGLAFDSAGRLLLVQKEDHCFEAFDLVNNVSQVYGRRGANDGQFECPTNIAVSKDGYIFVTDTLNQRVQYFKPNYSYYGQFGEWGNAPGKFCDPYGIALDSMGRLFVTSRKSGRIQLFERSTKDQDRTQRNPLGYIPVPNFRCEESDQAKLKQPVGIAIDQQYGYIYVTDDEDRKVSAFTSNGEYIASYTGDGHVQLSHPMGICVLENHNILVADCGNERLVEMCVIVHPQ